MRWGVVAGRFVRGVGPLVASELVGVERGQQRLGSGIVEGDRTQTDPGHTRDNASVRWS